MGNDRLALLIKVIGKLKKQLRSVLTVIRIFFFRREEKKEMERRKERGKRKERREKEKKIGEKWRKRQKRNP